MDVKLLEEIGLTDGETKVYLALLKLGSTKTGPLSKASNISPSKVYDILSRLEKKGLVGHIKKDNIMLFTAHDPNRILDYIDQKKSSLDKKKDEVEKLIPELMLQKKMTENTTKATLFEGFKAVTNIFRNILDDLKPGEEYFVIGAKYSDIQGIREFFEGHHKRRADRKIKVNMLANSTTRGNLVKTTALNSEVRYLPSYLISDMQIVFYKEKSYIILWTKNPVAFYINGEESVKGFRTYFDTFWKIAEK